MKKTLLSLTVAALVFATACQPQEKKTESTDSEAVEATAEPTEEELEAAAMEKAANEEGDGIHFGEMIDADGALTIDEFAMKMESADTLPVKIMATATDVCKKKGCWMKVQTADGSDMTIKFKDYGFFVPKDITGKNVVFEGIAYQEEVSVEDLKHLAEDGGESAEAIAAITEPEVQTTFMAHGVMIKE